MGSHAYIDANSLVSMECFCSSWPLSIQMCEAFSLTHPVLLVTFSRCSLCYLVLCTPQKQQGQGNHVCPWCVDMDIREYASTPYVGLTHFFFLFGGGDGNLPQMPKLISQAKTHISSLMLCGFGCYYLQKDS